MTPPDSPGALWLSRSAAALAILAAAVLLYRTRGFVVDDSYIPLRYAANWLAGNGIVWNAGEPVEGYTSFLMIALIAAGAKLGLGMLTASRLVQYAAFAFLLWRLPSYLASRCADRVQGRRLAAGITALLATHPPLILWANSGLDNVLFAALIAAAVIRLLEANERGVTSFAGAAFTGIVFGLACLTRPEGMLFLLFSSAYLLLSARRIDHRIVTPLVAGGIVAAHLLWRHAYYHAWLPNTYFVKLGGGMTRWHFISGWNYVWDTAKQPPFVFLALPLALYAAWRKPAARLADAWLAAMIIAYAAYVVYAGGDWMPAARLMLPVFPLSLLLIGRQMAAAPDRPLPWRFAAWLPMILLGWLLAAGWPKLEANAHPAFRPYLTAYAVYIRDHWPAHSLIAINVAGVIPAMTMNDRYIDMLGLGDAHIAHRPVDFGQEGMPGHYKGDGAYVLARRPDYIIFGSGMSVEAAPEFLSEKEIVQSPLFARDYTKHTVVIPFSDPELPGREPLTMTYFERKPEAK